RSVHPVLRLHHAALIPVFVDPLVMHSVPTRRSSDLPDPGAALVRCLAPPWPHRAFLRRPSRPWCGATLPCDRAALPFPSLVPRLDRKSTRLNSSHASTSYAAFCCRNKSTPGSTSDTS